MAGEFDWRSKLKSSFIRHIRGFIITGTIGIICLIYLYLSHKLTIRSTPVFLMVLSNCWGLFLIIVLLGYGIVEIPRQFWQSGNNSVQLSSLYMKIHKLSEDMLEVKYSLDETIKLLNAASYLLPKSSDLQENLNFVLSLCPLELIEYQRSVQSHLSKDAASQLGQITESTLVNLHKSLKDQLSEYQRSKYRFDDYLQRAFDLEDVISASESPFKRIVFSFKESKSGILARQIEVVEWMWLTRIKPVTYRILGLVFLFLSVLVILGECTLFIETPLALFPLLFDKAHGITLTQLYCVVPLLYIILCTYFGLFNLKLSGWYGLYGNNHTDPSNLVWSAFFIARLTAPLCLNFLLFLKVKNTVYSEYMQVIDVVPFVGSKFAIFFPLLLLVFAFLNFFQIYGKFMSALGMDSLSLGSKVRADKVSDGKSIVARNRTERERKLGGYGRGIEMSKDVRNNIQFKKT